MRFTIAIFSVVALVTMAASAAEFQPMGTIGIGGAGVARVKDGFAPYWNPAGLAFSEKVYSTRIDASAGGRINNDLAGSIDQLSKIDYNALTSIATNNSSGITPSQFGDAVKLVTLLDVIKERGGAISAGGNAVVGNQIKRFGFGIYGSFEAVALPDPDTTNILLAGSDISAAKTSISNMTATTSNGYFSSAERSQLNSVLSTAGFTNTNNIINAAESQLMNSGIAPTDAAAALTNIASAFSGSGGGSILNNSSQIHTLGLAYAEIPLSYGHPISLGRAGTLGIGASAKFMQGRIYRTDITMFNIGSGDILSKMTKNYHDSTSWGVDAGALWKIRTFSLGIVGKNLNTPTFTDDLGDKIKVKPQVRAGGAWDPFSWLSLAADVDVTSNETLLPGYKSRNLGGGIELHPFSWLKFRGGGYENLAESDIGPVATAGVTLGTKWVNFDVDGAYGLEKTTYKDRIFPKEARAQANLNIQF